MVIQEGLQSWSTHIQVESRNILVAKLQLKIAQSPEAEFCGHLLTPNLEIPSLMSESSIWREGSLDLLSASSQIVT